MYCCMPYYSMTKLRLAVFAIIAGSLMMGTSVLMAEAAKPTVEVIHNNLLECGDEEGCYTNPSTAENPLCGEVGARVFFDTLITKTSYGKEGNQDKFKLEGTWNGVAIDSEGLEIGSMSEEYTLNGHDSGKGAQVFKFEMKVYCYDGSVDSIERTVDVSNNGKQK